MSKEFAVQNLFDAVKTSNQGYANSLIAEAKREIGLLSDIKEISKAGKESLKMITKIIAAVSDNKINEAKKQYEKAERDFNCHVVYYLKIKLNEIKEVQSLPNNTSGQHREIKVDKGRRSHDDVNYSNEKPKQEPAEKNIEQKVKQDHVNEHRQSEILESKVPAHEETVNKRVPANISDGKLERSKLASFRMRQNNPNIADLSDPNRPTKIAERFSELYDNEWTEAFEGLLKNSRKEQEAIEILLGVVTEAYKFCEKEAEKQVKDIIKHWNAIFEFGADDYKKEKQSFEFQSPGTKPPKNIEDGKSLVIQYRKKLASNALPRLEKNFTEGAIKKIRQKASLASSSQAFDKYVKKVVELTWWMCVQDPPIFLCPPTKGGEGYDKNLYKAYTKSGTEPKFFVWPALRLYKEGGVLMKGVVQFQ